MNTQAARCLLAGFKSLMTESSTAETLGTTSYSKKNRRKAGRPLSPFCASKYGQDTGEMWGFYPKMPTNMGQNGATNLWGGSSFTYEMLVVPRKAEGRQRERVRENIY